MKRILIILLALVFCVSGVWSEDGKGHSFGTLELQNPYPAIFFKQNSVLIPRNISNRLTKLTLELLDQDVILLGHYDKGEKAGKGINNLGFLRAIEVKKFMVLVARSAGVKNYDIRIRVFSSGFKYPMGNPDRNRRVEFVIEDDQGITLR